MTQENDLKTCAVRAACRLQQRSRSNQSTQRWRYYGLLRSLLMYYGVLPFRGRQLKRFYAQFIRPGDLCFDVGAHVGNRTRIWTQLGARVVAVEPQPDFIAILRWLYGRRVPDIVLIEAALGASPGQAEMLVSQRTPTVTTLSAEWAAMVASRDESFAAIRWDPVPVTVPLTTLDALITEYGRPAFCKIDVEGFELEVLRGLSYPIAALSFEFIPAALEVALGCIERLLELGPDYEFNWATGESLALRSTAWLAGEAMIAQLKAIPAGDRSGDIYARLKGAGQ